MPITVLINVKLTSDEEKKGEKNDMRGGVNLINWLLVQQKSLIIVIVYYSTRLIGLKDHELTKGIVGYTLCQRIKIFG